MKRTAYYCAKCGAHHGHVFNDTQTTGPGQSGKGIAIMVFVNIYTSIIKIIFSGTIIC